MKRVILPMTALAAIALSTSGFAADDSSDSLTAQVKKLSAQTKKLQKEVVALKKNAGQPATQKAIAPVAQDGGSEKSWEHFVTVTTTPFLGKPTAFDGSDLIYNYASVNEDLLLLRKRNEIVSQMADTGYKIQRPIFQISGAVAGEAFSTGGFGTSATDGISLATGEFNFNAIASSWANAFISLDYNGAPVSSGNRAPNSTIYLSRGFLTIGNLDVTPIYFSMGQMYAPFGHYSNSMVSTPLTQSLAKTRTPTALLGFSLKDGLDGSVYGYTGSRTSGGAEVFKQGGANLNFKQKFGTNNSYALGTGWISNIADSQGMQNNGHSVSGGQFGGFAVQADGSTASNNDLAHNVDAMDANAQLTMGPVTFYGEYIDSLRQFATTDMTYNSAGAKPAAAHVEVDYTLPFFAKKHSTSIGTSYGRTWQALALNLPQVSYTAFLNTSIWRETQESLEYRHDNDYSASTIASGHGSTANTVGTGKSRNSVVGEVSVFF